MTTITTATVRLGTWTVLAETSETVQAVITREREVYTVRDAHGRVLGRYPTAQQALASIAS